jgi:hypothetical protein
VPVVLGIHLGLCALTATVGRWWVRAHSGVAHTEDNAATVLHLAAWTTLAGPFGTIIAAMLLVPQRCAAVVPTPVPIVWRHRRGNAAGAGGRREMTRLELLHSALLDRRLRIGGAHPIRPCSMS